MIWIPHELIPAFACVVDLSNLAAAMLLGAMIALQQFELPTLKLLYGISIFIRNLITGATVILTDEGAGIKLTAVNYYWIARYIPEFVWIEPQVEDDVPPYSQGTAVIPDPLTG